MLSTIVSAARLERQSPQRRLLGSVGIVPAPGLPRWSASRVPAAVRALRGKLGEPVQEEAAGVALGCGEQRRGARVARARTERQRALGGHRRAEPPAADG